MPAAKCEPPEPRRLRLLRKARHLEFDIDERPASPEEREAWIEELRKLDEELDDLYR